MEALDAKLRAATDTEEMFKTLDEESELRKEFEQKYSALIKGEASTT